MLPRYLMLLICLSPLAIVARGEGLMPKEEILTKVEFCDAFLKEDSSYVSFWNRRKLSRLEHIEIKTDDPIYGNTPWKGRNTLFIFAKKATLSQDQIITQWKKALDPLEKFSKDARYIKRADNTNECLERMAKRKFDYQSFLNTTKKVTLELNRLKPELEALSVAKEIDDLSSKVKSRWYIRRVFHMNDLKEELLKLDSKNIFIVAHARENGQIIDSFDNALPASFFKNISPSIFSLSLYNCFSAKTLDFYDLKKNLREENFYKYRFLFGVEESEDYNQDQYAPLSRAHKFINKVDRKIRRHIGDAFWGFEAQEDYCSISLEIENFELLSLDPEAEIHISVSGDYLGTLRAGHRNLIQLDCQYLKKGNILMARPNQALSTNLKDIKLIFSNSIHLTHEQLFTREGQIIGKKITF